MENVVKNVFELETTVKFLAKGNSGAVYEFNSIPCDGDIKKLSQHLGCKYSGIYLFATKEEANELCNVLLKGESDDIAKAMEEAEKKGILPVLGATHFCYAYEPSEEIRKTIESDICQG